MTLNNMDIREQIAKKRLRFYEVAQVMGVHPATLTRWLRYELPPERKAEIMKAIKSIKL